MVKNLDDKYTLGFMYLHTTRPRVLVSSVSLIEAWDEFNHLSRIKLYVITSVFRAIPQFAIACKDHRDLGGAQCSRRERYSGGGQT